jgi:hypothetical protein
MMSSPGSSREEEFNPYAPPQGGSRTLPISPAELLVRDYRGRARTIRALAVFHFLFATFVILISIALVALAVFYWTELLADLNGQVVHPKQWWSRHRSDIFWCLVSAVVLLTIGGASAGVGIGLWMFRRWAGWLAIGQAFFVFVTGSSMCLYDLSVAGAASGVGWVIPGLILLLLGGFVRSQRSALVCSDAYRDARAKIKLTGI